ncbi:MAG: phage tail protein [Pseudomonadota bacterium]
MQISIKTNFPDVQRRMDGMRREVAEQATVRAVNRTLEQAKTRMSRSIRAEFNISTSKVNQSLRIERAKYHGGIYTVTGMLESPTKRGRSINLINFEARKTARGVSVKVMRKGGRKEIRGAFIANKGRTVFKREGKGRLPIVALQTIDVAQMFNTRRVNALVVAMINAKFPEIFEREAKFYTDRFNRS